MHPTTKVFLRFFGSWTAGGLLAVRLGCPPLAWVVGSFVWAIGTAVAMKMFPDG